MDILAEFCSISLYLRLASWQVGPQKKAIERRERHKILNSAKLLIFCPPPCSPILLPLFGKARRLSSFMTAANALNKAGVTSFTALHVTLMRTEEKAGQ